MINGGFACLADGVHTRCLQRRGWPPFPAPLLSTKHCKQGDQYKYNAQSHDQGCNVMFMVAMCSQFLLREVGCKVICKFTPNLNSKECHMHVCYCSPILKWSNI